MGPLKNQLDSYMDAMIEGVCGKYWEGGGSYTEGKLAGLGSGGG